MNPKTVLRKEDCEVPRTAEKLIAWIESVKDQFNADDRIEKILIKAFFEEIRPLGDLARHKYLGRPGLYLRPKIGDQDYDAEIIDRSSSDEKIARVEFTSAYRDPDLALRLEYLAQHGDVYMTGYVGRNGTRASGGQVYVVPDFEDHQILLDKMLNNIKARVANKLGKPYAANTILAIVFNDSILNAETDFPQFQPHFRDIMLSNQALGKFCGVFAIGASGRTFWEFGETASTDLTRRLDPIRLPDATDPESLILESVGLPDTLRGSPSFLVRISFRRFISSTGHPPALSDDHDQNQEQQCNRQCTKNTHDDLCPARVSHHLRPPPILAWPQCFRPCFTGLPVLSPARSRPSYCAVGPEWVAKVIKSGSRRWKPHHYQLIKKQTPKRPSLLKTA